MNVTDDWSAQMGLLSRATRLPVDPLGCNSSHWIKTSRSISLSKQRVWVAVNDFFYRIADLQYCRFLLLQISANSLISAFAELQKAALPSRFGLHFFQGLLLL